MLNQIPFPSLLMAVIMDDHATVASSQGSVSSMCTRGDLLVVCGMLSRTNPYNTKIPQQFFPDAMVKVYDLRMMRQTSPLNFSPAMVGPSLLGAFLQRVTRLKQGAVVIMIQA